MTADTYVEPLIGKCGGAGPTKARALRPIKGRSERLRLTCEVEESAPRQRPCLAPAYLIAFLAWIPACTGMTWEADSHSFLVYLPGYLPLPSRGHDEGRHAAAPCLPGPCHLPAQAAIQRLLHTCP